MKTINFCVRALVTASAVFVAGCGSGYVETAQVSPPLFTNIAFKLDMFINGDFVPQVYVEPGYEQDVPMQAGSKFEVIASGPVQWTVTIDGTVVNPPLGTAVVFNGATLFPITISSGRYTAIASAQGFLSRAPVISIIATSLVDSRQEANINIFLTN
jgi:hypothetical protein